MSWLSNLYKAGFVNYNNTESFVIDSNELANRKIEAFQELELKKQREELGQEEGFSDEFSEDPDFIPGIDMEQLSQLTEDQPEMMDSFPDPQFDMEAMQAEMDLKLQQAQEQADAIVKNANEQVQTAIFNNLSKRLAVMIKEDMDFMGPVRMKDVEEAQQKIVGIIRKLEDSAEIVISRGGGDELVV